jgi:uncharacterized protein (TIGR02453 family)
MTFLGVPHAAAEFYARLEEDNSRDFWAAHREAYERDVRGPMSALLDALEEEFGPAKVFRPQRDVRFSADKSPYKTHQGGDVEQATRTGWYAEVSADGFRVGGGCYAMDAATLAAYRAAVDGPRGAELERLVERLRDDGWEIGGEQLRTAPRGVRRDHPRLDLLRRRALTAVRWVEDGDVVTRPALLDHVRERWREVRPLVEWLAPLVRG